VLRALTAFFDSATGDETAPYSRERELQLATAILLIEVARADFSQDDEEIRVMAGLLESHLELEREDVVRLIEDAMAEADHHASLQSFTRQLHEELDHPEKLRIVELLWRVALADSVLDKHEDHLIRKIAGLLYISHSDLIRVRNRVRDSHG
jgi:uncharacterized tellurite resistance protein B-like protein